MNSIFPLLALWGNKNWPPSMKVKKLENFGNKSGLKGCKWSSLNAPGTENPLSHSLLELGESPFRILIAPNGEIIFFQVLQFPRIPDMKSPHPTNRNHFSNSDLMDFPPLLLIGTPRCDSPFRYLPPVPSASRLRLFSGDITNGLPGYPP